MIFIYRYTVDYTMISVRDWVSSRFFWLLRMARIRQNTLFELLIPACFRLCFSVMTTPNQPALLRGWTPWKFSRSWFNIFQHWPMKKWVMSFLPPMTGNGLYKLFSRMYMYLWWGGRLIVGLYPQRNLNGWLYKQHPLIPIKHGWEIPEQSGGFFIGINKRENHGPQKLEIVEDAMVDSRKSAYAK